MARLGYRQWFVGFALAGFLMGGAGCGFLHIPKFGSKKADNQFKVVPFGNRNAILLDASDIVSIMRKAGFSDRQVFDLGTQLRDALRDSGGAQMRIGKEVEAIFAVQGDQVYITSRTRGSFIYDAKSQGFPLGGGEGMP